MFDLQDTSSQRHAKYATSIISVSTVGTTSTTVREIKQIRSDIARLNNQPLTEQRYELSMAKKQEMDRLRLRAKVEKALGRRLEDQDYVPKNAFLEEKMIDIKV